MVWSSIDGVGAVVTLRGRDERLLREAIAISNRSRMNGNHPFGALLADVNGEVLLEAENCVVTSGDATGHAEIELVRMASRALPLVMLAVATLFTSAEPCAMCAGAIYWAGIGRVVYAMAETNLGALTGSHPENPTLDLGCRTVFAAGQRHTEVVGPVLADEAIAIHEGFWDQGPGDRRAIVRSRVEPGPTWPRRFAAPYPNFWSLLPDVSRTCGGPDGR